MLKSLIALLAIGLIFYASRFLMANLYAKHVEYELSSWPNVSNLSVEHVNKVLVSAQRANRFHPDHPYYLTLEGKVWQWLFLLSNSSDDSTLDQALILFKQALALRPHWANNHADVVRTKLWLEQIDEEFMLAFERANLYGPMTAQVHQVLAEAGLLSWAKLDKTLRQATSRHIALGLLNRQSQTEVIRFLNNQQRLAYGCALARNRVKADATIGEHQLPRVCRRK
ncbi:hypothetical protein K6Y31_09780 [Motilimonas cestriensis]|uniref:Uncharacterized protein n=1 Tax=Motilimonas cestriensis TaxID=2742685 RepID=A0ABS8WAH9_9GAMM|nr:hypothetical protein [Motilimonas cestriensis]MCE2595107.1 hypothetical protein [Motilimonas cestriensis]